MLEDIEDDFPGIISGMAEHDGIGFVMVRSQARGLMALGKNGVNFLDEGRVEGTDPLVKFGPQAKSCLLRLDTFPHVGDLVVNSLYDTDTQEVAAFEELVGSHGGLGGPQTKPFILFPGHWSIEDKDIVGAHQVYGVLCRWRDEDLIQSA